MPILNPYILTLKTETETETDEKNTGTISHCGLIVRFLVRGRLIFHCVWIIIVIPSIH